MKILARVVNAPVSMHKKRAAAVLTVLFGCQCGGRQPKRVAHAPANVLDAAEIVGATGAAAPYFHPPADEEDRQAVRGGAAERIREPPASAKEDPQIPSTGAHAEKAPAEVRTAPPDAPDAGAAGSPEDAGASRDAG